MLPTWHGVERGKGGWGMGWGGREEKREVRSEDEQGGATTQTLLAVGSLN